jgi:hypothetical protein
MLTMAATASDAIGTGGDCYQMADSPLEGDGFEPSVPRQKDLMQTPEIAADREHRGCRSAGKTPKMPIWQRSAPLLTRCSRSTKLAGFLCSPSRVRVA